MRLHSVLAFWQTKHGLISGIFLRNVGCDCHTVVSFTTLCCNLNHRSDSSPFPVNDGCSTFLASPKRENNLDSKVMHFLSWHGPSARSQTSSSSMKLSVLLLSMNRWRWVVP